MILGAGPAKALQGRFLQVREIYTSGLTRVSFLPSSGAQARESR
jgi:hypothetical protein